MGVVVPREKALGKRVERLLDSRSAWWMKTQPPNRNGVTDYLVCYRGRFIGIETKTVRGVVSAIQAHEMRKIARAGGVALPVRSIDEVKAVLDAVDEELSTATLAKGTRIAHTGRSTP